MAIVLTRVVRLVGATEAGPFLDVGLVRVNRRVLGRVSVMGSMSASSSVRDRSRSASRAASIMLFSGKVALSEAMDAVDVADPFRAVEEPLFRPPFPPFLDSGGGGGIATASIICVSPL